MNVVVVESPAKAKTINKYLGPDYLVLASYGHVRDLPAKNGSVDPNDDFAMIWEVDARGEKRLKEIAKAVKGAKQLILATDPDREGEAISWHIAEELKRRRVLEGVTVHRVVFNEVTKRSVVEAFSRPHALNKELIEAYLARRALDYLVGFTLSPVLWRKLPGSRSAGRVQSVALRLICEREAEIEVFRAREYWSVEVLLTTPAGHPFTARLTQLQDRKLAKYDLADETAARAAADLLETAETFTVAAVEGKRTRRHPAPPFTTSTLQQDASRRLGFGATRTMRIAQRLYEGIDLQGETVGLITYMRTDGVRVSGESIGAARRLIQDRFGAEYLPAAPRIYKTKARNAQEAHEAIRPTDLLRRPRDLTTYLEPDALKLYELIWNRMLASQMESAQIDQVAVDISVDEGRAQLRASGSVIAFRGFLALYRETGEEQADGGRTDQDKDQERRLPALKEAQRVARQKVLPEQHFTQPPPRYSEAALVKKLEELGIGRPSTYASIMEVLQARDYVRLEKRRFLPEDRGRLVTAFLSSFFPRYVEYDFTANLEAQLDDISDGRLKWKTVLQQFWVAFDEAIGGTKDLSITQVIDALDRDLGPHFFPVDPDQADQDPRVCPACRQGRLGLRLGRSGGFIGCSKYPECRYTRPLAVAKEGAGAGDLELLQPLELGLDPETGLSVTLRKGPYGPYVQLGEGKDKEKPKRCSLPNGMALAEVTLRFALALLALPREVGRHPETGSAITAGVGRYGPYVKHGPTYRSLSAADDVTVIGLNRAVALLADAPARRASAGKEIGAHPADGKPITLHSGRYGPYVKHGRTIASLTKGLAAEGLSLEQAVALLAARAAKAKGAKPKGTRKTTGKKVKKTKKSTAGTKKSGTTRRRKSSAGKSAD